MTYDHLIDSSAWMENFSGTQAGIQIEKILQKGNNCTTILVLAELADKFERENLEFHQFFEYIKSKAVILPVTEETALKAASIKKQLRKTAPDTSLIDAINLATTRDMHAKLITCDSDFKNAHDAIIIPNNIKS